MEDLGQEFSQPLSDAVHGRTGRQDESPQKALFDELGHLWKELPRKRATADARGRGLEHFAGKLLGAYFDVVDVRSRHQVGEVDIVCENVKTDPFWATYGGDIWVECKNTEAKATIEQVNTFIGKLVGSRWKLGFFFSVSGFTKDAMGRLRNVGNNPGIPLIASISGDDIDELLLHPTDLQRFFKASIRRFA